DLCDCSTIRIDVSCNQTCVAKPANCTNYACDSVESNGQFCARYGKNCSSFTGLDDCGKTKTVNCGSCYSFQTCNTNVCSNPVGSTSWVGNGSGDAACGKLGKECINAYKETGASAPFCSSILTNGGTAICKSTTIGTGTAWTGNGSPDAACGKIGKETVTFKYWDGTGARVAASSSTTTNGGTTICQNTTLTGTVINWTGNGKADTLCKNIGKKCMFNHIWDGTGKSIFGSTTTTNGGTVICE
ncbi:MAG: hypothetical protein PHX27_04310, partial [Candidatus ainarchaeum sp.]|nr:hypothetical protein [Candidatus ainarchaeum sp.]